MAKSTSMNSPFTAAQADHSELIQRTIASIGKALLGKQEEVKLALCCLFAGGHLLIEDLPGMGKTTLAHAIGKTLGLNYQRLQFTSDMLPSDVLGSSVYIKSTSTFDFLQGPIFTQLLLADEVNRTTPKTQSALLEAMEEGQVSVDGSTYELPKPFFVIATQNPSHQSGTYPLPESQLDRFLMKISIGYPSPDAERLLLKDNGKNRRQHATAQVLTPETLMDIQAKCDEVTTSDVLLDYLQRLVEYSRTEPDFAYGISPRGALAVLAAAKAWALIHGRGHCLPEDIQFVLPAVAAHRLSSRSRGVSGGDALVAQMLDAVDVV